MTISVIQKFSSAFTDTSLPKLYRDPLLNSGSKFLFDFLNPYCNPNADGSLAAGSTFNNLVDGAPTGSVVGSSYSSLTGKAGLYSAATNSADYLNFGTSYDLHTSGDEFIAIIWFKNSATGYNAGAYPTLFALTAGNANAAQWWFDLGADGKTPRAGGGTGSNNYIQPCGASGTGLGSVSQLATHIKPSTGLVEAYYDGSLVSSGTYGAFSLPNNSANNALVSGLSNGTTYRVYHEDLTVSGATAAAQIAADYAANSGRFT